MLQDRIEGCGVGAAHLTQKYCHTNVLLYRSSVASTVRTCTHQLEAVPHDRRWYHPASQLVFVQH